MPIQLAVENKSSVGNVAPSGLSIGDFKAPLWLLFVPIASKWH